MKFGGCIQSRSVLLVLLVFLIHGCASVTDQRPRQTFWVESFAVSLEGEHADFASESEVTAQMRQAFEWYLLAQGRLAASADSADLVLDVQVDYRRILDTGAIARLAIGGVYLASADVGYSVHIRSASGWKHDMVEPKKRLVPTGLLHDAKLMSSLLTRRSNADTDQLYISKVPEKIADQLIGLTLPVSASAINP